MRTQTKQFMGTCVENPFNSISMLCEVVENAKEITKRTFFKHCFVHPETSQQMKQFPHDYSYSKYKNIYFFTWSRIEHFYW